MRQGTVWVGAALVLLGCKKDPAPAPPATTANPSVAAPATSAEAPPERNHSAGVVRLEAAVGVGDEFGYGVATVDERVVVTAFKRKGKSDDGRPGAVFVFKAGPGKLEPEAELTVDGSHQLGNALAFDGSVILTGALYDKGKAPETGAAYVFSREASGWSKGQKLAAADSKRDDAFGIGVAVSGGVAIVCNSREAGGSLYLHERGKAGFVAKKSVAFPHQNGPAELIAASSDFVVVGAPNVGKLSEQGLVFVYRRDKDKGGLSQPAELSEPGAGEGQHFGSSVAVSKTTLAVTSEKQVSVFSESGGEWKEAQRLTPPVTTGLATAALALTDERLAIGFYLVDAGRVLLYRKAEGQWKLERTVTAADGKNEDWFGYAVALSDKRLVVGAPLASERTGAAYALGF